MNLHSIVGPLIGSVNPNMTVSIQVSTGYTTAADGSRVATFADPVNVTAQVQPVSWRDLQQLDGLNLQGIRRVVYLDGEIDGLVRSTNQGGDLVIFPDGTTWLVAMILEGFNATAGWTKAAIVLQNGA